MPGVSDTISKILDFFTNGYETETVENPLDELVREVGTSYSADGNAARAPEYVTTPIKKQSPKSNDNVASFPGSRGTELMVIEPRSFSEDSMQLIKYLQEGRTIVLNLHLLDKEQAQRLVDFVSGATQALHGHQQKIADAVFIFAPTNISISADSLKAKASISDGIWSQKQY